MPSQVSTCLPVPYAFPLAEEPDILTHSDGRAEVKIDNTNIHTHWTASYHDYIQHQGTFTTSGDTAQHHLGQFVRPSGPNFISSGNIVGPAWGKAVSANISVSIGYGDHHEKLKARNQPFLHGAILATVT